MGKWGLWLWGWMIFFFKQKTAYEIGTGDWSSDVLFRSNQDELGQIIHVKYDWNFFSCLRAKANVGCRLFFQIDRHWITPPERVKIYPTLYVIIVNSPSPITPSSDHRQVTIYKQSTFCGRTAAQGCQSLLLVRRRSYTNETKWLV